MRNRHFTAILLSISLIFSFNLSVPASVKRPDTADKDITAKLESTASELTSLVPGEDYVDGEGVFLADSEDKARDVAASYGGTLNSFHDGIAVMRFSCSTAEVYEGAASLSSVTEYVQPNYIYHFCDTEEPEVFPEADAPINDDPADADAVLYSKDAPNDLYADNSNYYYQYFHDKIHTLEAQKITTGKGAKIAVIDSGCNPVHEDSPFDSSHCLCVSAYSNGIDISQGHGIHCTGIIHETKDNTLGGYGIAPDAEIYSIKATNGTDLTTDGILEAIQMAIDLKVNVISMSFSGTRSGDVEQELIDKAYESGITCVAASGNHKSSKKYYPAACDHVISVAASDKDDNLASYSNYGDWVDIVAPGSKITAAFCYAPYNSGFIAGTASQNSYACIDGTSMACPVVAGVAALCYASNPDLLEGEADESRADIVTEILLNSTDNETYAYGDHSVTGLIQADKAVSEASEIYVRNSLYHLVDEAGIHGVRLKENIACGKKVNLTIGDSSGNIKDKNLKKAAKNATWTSSDTSILTVKKGKVKCEKNAPLGSEVTVTASLDGEEMKCTFTVTEPIIAAGYISAETGKNGKLKIKKLNAPTTWHTYDGKFDLRCPSKNTIPAYGSYLCLAFSKDSSRYYNGTWAQYMDDSYNYKIVIPKKSLRNMDVEYDKMGRAVSVTFHSSGKYKIKFTPIDGSRKTFTCKMDVY